MMCSNDRVDYGPIIALVYLHITQPQYYNIIIIQGYLKVLDF